MEQDLESNVISETQKVVVLMSASEENISSMTQKQKEYDAYITELLEYLDSLTNFNIDSEGALNVNYFHNMSLEHLRVGCKNELQLLINHICDGILNEKNDLIYLKEKLSIVEQLNLEKSDKYLNAIKNLENCVNEKNKNLGESERQSLDLENSLLAEVNKLEEQIEEAKEFSRKNEEVEKDQNFEECLKNISSRFEQTEQDLADLLTKKELIEESMKKIECDNTDLKEKQILLTSQDNKRIVDTEADINGINQRVDKQKSMYQTICENELDLINEIKKFEEECEKIKKSTGDIEEKLSLLNEKLSADVILKEDVFNRNNKLISQESEAVKTICEEIEILKVETFEMEKAIEEINESSNALLQSKINIEEEIFKYQDEYNKIDLEKLNTGKDRHDYLIVMQMELQELSKSTTEILENFNCNSVIRDNIDSLQNEILTLENSNNSISLQINEETLFLKKANLDKEQNEGKELEIEKEKNQMDSLSAEIDKIASAKAKLIEAKKQKIVKDGNGASDSTNFTRPKTPTKPLNLPEKVNVRHWDSDSSVEGEINCFDLIKSNEAKKKKSEKGSIKMR